MATGSKKGLVVYTEDMKQIIKDEAANHPNNLKEGFRVAAERIKKEHKIDSITANKISTHYYTYFNDRKAESRPSRKKANKVVANTKPTQKRSAPTDKKDTMVFVDEQTNMQYQVARDLTSTLDAKRKIQLIKDLYADLARA